MWKELPAPRRAVELHKNAYIIQLSFKPFWARLAWSHQKQSRFGPGYYLDGRPLGKPIKQRQALASHLCLFLILKTLWGSHKLTRTWRPFPSQLEAGVLLMLKLRSFCPKASILLFSTAQKKRPGQAQKLCVVLCRKLDFGLFCITCQQDCLRECIPLDTQSTFRWESSITIGHIPTIE